MFSKRILLIAPLCVLGVVAACTENNTPAVSPQEFGFFSLPVGEPINLISATRGDGVSFDKFQVTFNNAEGTDITITTPEGESINFTEADLEWVGNDGSLGGMPIAKFTSSRGDRADVILGSVRVPLPPPVDEEPVPQDVIVDDSTEEIYVAAIGRLDEADTRAGFESYGVVGFQTDPAGLPRYQEDVFVGDTDEVTPAGSLAEGTAYYAGGFLASVYAFGEVRSDSAYGDAYLEINFASGDVDVWMEGSYRYDDTDDVAPGAVIGITVTTDVIDGIEYVSSITPVYGDPGLSGQVVTDVEFTTRNDVLTGTFINMPFPIPDFVDVDGTATVVTSVTPVYGPVSGGNIVTALDVATVTTGDMTVVTNVGTMRAFENDDNYCVFLSGSGGPTDVSFDNGVTYTGELGGVVEVSVDKYGTTWSPYVEGTFAGAVFGPGAGADTVDPANFGEVVDATATAGVFEAGGGALDGDPSVQIVGGYFAGSDGFEADPFEPVPPPEPEPPSEPSAN